MINLLPPSLVTKMRLGRINSLLRKWLLALVAATAGLLIIYGVGWGYLKHQNSSLQRRLDNVGQQLASQNLSSVQKQAQQINSNVKIINQVLSREIRFSDLIQQIGTIMPPGTVLNSLTLGKVDGPLDLSASAKDYNSATQIAVNLSDPKNDLFSKVDIVSVNCPTNAASEYACNAALKVLFNKTAKTKYLNAAGSTTK